MRNALSDKSYIDDVWLARIQSYLTRAHPDTTMRRKRKHCRRQCELFFGLIDVQYVTMFLFTLLASYPLL